MRGNAVRFLGLPVRALAADFRRAGFDHAGAGGLALGDLNGARLHRFGQLALQIDMQEAVLKRGSRHLDIFGEAETALEIARGDALVDVLADFFLALFLAADGQRAFLDLKRQVAVAKAATAMEMR